MKQKSSYTKSFLKKDNIDVVDFKNILDRDFPGGPVVKTIYSTAGGTGSIPGWETKIPHAVCSWKIEKKII